MVALDSWCGLVEVSLSEQVLVFLGCYKCASFDRGVSVSFCYSVREGISFEQEARLER